ncbi:MAG TPA: hypothetical protein VIM65_04040 [Cyclobacteriaceae bacterium]
MSKGWRILGCVAFGALIALVFGYITMLLWNWLVPELFHGPMITFWQAVGLLVLSKILFHGLGKGGRHWKKDQCGDYSDHDHWKGKVFDKFSSMSPEEREAFKKKMREKWCIRDQNRAGSGTGDSSAN